MNAPRHWLDEIDHASNNLAIRESLRQMVKRETTAAYDAGVTDTERRLGGAELIPPAYVEPRVVVDGTPPSYFTPATADPAVERPAYSPEDLTAWARAGEAMRYPGGPFTVTREELGAFQDDLGQIPLDQVKREGGSPVRVYLLRHLDEAQTALGYARTVLEDAERDHLAAANTVDSILSALGHLDTLENRVDHEAGDPHR